MSYRQAPVFADGAFVDTMEVAARWSNLGALYDGVRRALGEHVFVMAHFSHAYPDGCCIYFSFAGSADRGRVARARLGRRVRGDLRPRVAGGARGGRRGGRDARAPPRRGALEGAAPAAELGAGVDVVRALMRAFDPGRHPEPRQPDPCRGQRSARDPRPGSRRRGRRFREVRPSPRARTASRSIRRASWRCVGGGTEVATLERQLAEAGLTLDARFEGAATGVTLADWLARGAPGARDRWLDPADQLLAGLDATLVDGRSLRIRPAPRRAVGPDLSALFVGAGGRFGRIDAAWLRVHALGVPRPVSPSFRLDRDPPLSTDEASLLDQVASTLARQRG